MHTWTYVCTHSPYTYIDIKTCTHRSIITHIHIYTDIHAGMCTIHIYKFKDINIHKYVHAQIHT